jgi:uncharacterized oligopeptide transporter (OPT) family protein
LKDAQPLVSASVKFYEITDKVVVLTAAIIYLGLFTGMTVSVSISAAVASRAILRFFHESNILENNVVQTMASSGEALLPD